MIFSGIFFFFYFFFSFSFLVCSVANNSFTYFKLQFIFNRKVNISIRILGEKKNKKNGPSCTQRWFKSWNNVSQSCFNVDSPFGVSWESSCERFHYSQKKKKKKKCERSSAKIFQYGDVKWSAAAKGMLCSAMNVEKINSAPVTFSGVVALNNVAIFGIILLRLALRCVSILCFVWLCRSFHPWWHRKLSCKMY